MCDIFLILYLTAQIEVTPSSALTVGDFLELKSMHEDIQSEKERSEETFSLQIEDLQEERQKALLAKQELEAKAQSRLDQLAEEKKKLNAQLSQQKAQHNDLESTLALNVLELARTQEEVRSKEEEIQGNEELLENLRIAEERKIKNLNQEIALKGKEYEQKQRALQETLRLRSADLAAAYKVTQEVRAQVDSAKQRMEVLQAKSAQALADAAKVSQQQAEDIDQAKQLADKRAREAEALKVQLSEQKVQAEQKEKVLTDEISIIKEHGALAYQKNISSKLQTIDVSYEKTRSGKVILRKLQFHMLPVNIKGQNYVFIPLRHLGYNLRFNKAPKALSVSNEDLKINQALINKPLGLMAIPVNFYKGESHTPHSPQMDISQLMPTLLALRNNASRNLSDIVRGISKDYFIVNKNYLKPGEEAILLYKRKGIRGTGTRGERILQGDQLVDLNGQFIGVASEHNKIIRLDSVEGWTAVSFE